MRKEICNTANPEMSNFISNVQPNTSLAVSEHLSKPEIKANETKDKEFFGSNDVNEKIAKIFIVIGIPAHITGYYYLREAIKLAAGNFEMVSNITTKLYPEVASFFNTSTGRVERCIRNAIDIAWNKNKIINLNTVFGLVVLERNDKPSSGELIALLAEKVYLDCF